MSKYELTISPDYLPHWGTVEAVRELFQNALDNQTVDPENEMFFDYDPEKQVLSVGNKTSVLEPKTLLLGYTTKRDDSRTIGVHGEGYKAAFLILLREGKTVQVLNYGAKEEWLVRLVKSRRYQGLQVVCVETKKKIFERVPDRNLQFIVGGVTPEEYESIVTGNLHLQDPGAVLDFPDYPGRILLEGRYSSKVFVNGLYVCSMPGFRYGYDLSPRHIQLDRDRRAVDSFTLGLHSSCLWSLHGDVELVTSLMEEGLPDVQSVKRSSIFSEITSNTAKISKHVHEKFIAEHGENAIPVKDDHTLQRVRDIPDAKPVMVREQVYHYFPIEKMLQDRGVPEKPIDEAFLDWFAPLSYKLSPAERDAFKALVDRL